MPTFRRPHHADAGGLLTPTQPGRHRGGGGGTGYLTGSVESLIEAQLLMKNQWSSPNIRIPLDLLEEEDEDGRDGGSDDEDDFIKGRRTYGRGGGHGGGGMAEGVGAPAAAPARPTTQGSRKSGSRSGKRVKIP